MIACPHCRVENDADDERCVVCQKPLGATPVARQGQRFVAYRDATLPPCCVKCGAPADTPPRRKTFYWHEPLLYLLIFGGVLLYAIVAVIVRKRFDLAVPLCEAHLRRRRNLRWIGGGLIAACAVLTIASIVNASSPPGGRSDTIQAVSCIAAFVSMVAGLIVYGLAERTIVPKRITEETAEFTGACDAFLATLE